MTSLPTLLAAADPGSEALGPVAEIIAKFGVDWGFLVPQVINFCLVAIVLWRFAFKPIIKTIDERQSRIAAGLDYAEEMKRKLAEAEAQQAEALREAQLKAQQIIQEARESAKLAVDRSAQEAAAQAEAILRKAEQTIEQERVKMMADVRAEIATLVVETTSKVLGKKLSKADRSSYSQAAAKELASVN